jgi:hypothetical protein
VERAGRVAQCGDTGVEPQQCWSEEARTRTRTQIIAHSGRDMIVLYNVVLRSKVVLGKAERDAAGDAQRRSWRTGRARVGRRTIRRAVNVEEQERISARSSASLRSTHWQRIRSETPMRQARAMRGRGDAQRGAD